MEETIENGRKAKRCTVLFDTEAYRKVRGKANDADFKLYEYLNNLMAKDVGMKPLYLSKTEKEKGKKPTAGLRHATTKNEIEVKETSV